jgi:phosphatidylglycerol:prolipoprotein diacylglycerol transferase
VRDAAGAWRYPAALAEAAFHLSAAALFAVLLLKGRMRGQLFHLYLIGYGVFRFVSEYWRETPRIAGAFSPYQALSLVVAVFGVWKYCERRASGILPTGGAAGGAAAGER